MIGKIIGEQPQEENKNVQNKTRGFEIVSDEHRKYPNNIVMLPMRGSKSSAGYDLFANEEVTLMPGTQFVFWTDVKAYMQPDEVLKVYVRSSLGIKKRVVLGNQVGIIDSDYYSNPNNDGNIGVCLRNISDKSIDIEQGDAIAQCIFIKFLESDNGNTEEERKGGIGSTGK